MVVGSWIWWVGLGPPSQWVSQKVLQESVQSPTFDRLVIEGWNSVRYPGRNIALTDCDPVPKRNRPYHFITNSLSWEAEIWWADEATPVPATLSSSWAENCNNWYSHLRQQIKFGGLRGGYPLQQDANRIIVRSRKWVCRKGYQSQRGAYHVARQCQAFSPITDFRTAGRMQCKFGGLRGRAHDMRCSGIKCLIMAATFFRCAVATIF